MMVLGVVVGGVGVAVVRWGAGEVARWWRCVEVGGFVVVGFCGGGGGGGWWVVGGEWWVVGGG